MLRIEGLLVGPAGAPRLGPLDLAVEAGAATALTGRSGSGKTQVLRALAGFEPAAWDRARLGKEDLKALHPRRRRRALVYVHQEAVRFQGTVRDDLASVRGLGPDGSPGDEPWERVLAWLERLGLGPEIPPRVTSALSVGEMRRVALARALQVRPRVLLLDEPTAGLDEHAAGLVSDLLREWLAEAPGRGALVATHDRELIRALAARTVELAALAPLAEAAP